MKKKHVVMPHYKAMYQEAMALVASLRMEIQELKTEAFDKELDKTAKSAPQQNPYDILAYLLVKTADIIAASK